MNSIRILVRCAATAVCTCSALITTVHAEEANQPVYTIMFSVGNLPVWRLDEHGTPQFDASFLIAHIKANVEPESWKNDGVMIEQYPKEKCLIVAQTGDALDKIGGFLRRYAAFMHDDAEGELKKNLDIARHSSQRVLLFMAAANSEFADDFFAAQFNEAGPESLGKAFDYYAIQCLTPEQAEQIRSRGIAVPERGAACVTILDPAGAIVAESDFQKFRADGALSPILLLEFLKTHREELPDANEELAAALAQAARDDKRVFVQMCGPGCGPCVRLSRYLEDQSDLLAKDYVYVKLDTRMANADKLTDELVGGFNRVPWTAILSKDGEALITSLSGEQNLAVPASDEAKEHFRQMLTTTSLRLSTVEIDGILDKKTP